MHQIEAWQCIFLNLISEKKKMITKSNFTKYLIDFDKSLTYFLLVISPTTSPDARELD